MGKKSSSKILFIQKSELMSVIRELDELESALESYQEPNIIPNEEILKESINESKKAFMEVLDAFYEFSPQKIENEKKKLEELFDLNLMKEAITVIQSVPKKSVIYVSLSLLYLSSIMIPHAIVTRYPVNSHDPLKIYNKNLPLIQLFDDMAVIMDKTLSKMKNLLFEI